MPDTSHISQILGTAGHIDHGKSSLVKALTGVDPDRLREEKERGITIELGFTKLELPDGTTLGVVDVPGHERFVRQMIAGASGIDLALLCIAADDGVMPQTVEHLAVLELLGINNLLVALTKCDLVDEEWQLFMTDEIARYLESTSYAGSEIIPVSARTGDGLDALKRAIQAEVQQSSKTLGDGVVRLPVDRVFTIKGSGTVITGTLWSGTVATTDELEVLPSGIRAHVRSIEVHGAQVDQAQPGNRVALNLSNLKREDIEPGSFLVTPGAIEPADRFDAMFTYLDPAKTEKPLKTGSRVHVSHGTKEVIGRLLLMDGRESIAPGERHLVQFRLDEVLPVSYQDRFVVRSYSPQHVIGGGEVLLVSPRRKTNLSDLDHALLEALTTHNTNDIVKAAVMLQKTPFTLSDISHKTGLSNASLRMTLDSLLASGAVMRVGDAEKNEHFATKKVLQALMGEIENKLLTFHAKHPDEAGMSKGALHAALKHYVNDKCFEAVLTEASAKGKTVVAKGLVSHSQAGAGAQQVEEQAAQKIVQLLQATPETPPSVVQVATQLKLSSSIVSRALARLESQGLIVRVNKELCLTKETYDAFFEAVKEHLARYGEATAAELRDAMGTSRKIAIPLLEYFDQQGITARKGDNRVLKG